MSTVTTASAGVPEQEGSAPPSQPEPRAAAPLLAIAGLCGGAGASTLALLAARRMTQDAQAPVLVCDTGGPTGGLASYARVSAPRSLARTAAAVAAREPLAGGLFADGGDGLRVMAGAPEPVVGADAGATARVLADARAAHALTVVDCGIAATALDRQVLEIASHVVWVLPATASGLRRGGRTLELHEPRPERREILVARHDAAGAAPPLSALKLLAAERRAPLLLVPHLPDLAEEPPDAALELAGEALDALMAELRR